MFCQVSTLAFGLWTLAFGLAIGKRIAPVPAMQSGYLGVPWPAEHDRPAQPSPSRMLEWLLGPDVVAAHCVWLSDREIELIRESGTHISYDPVSNAKLGNGVARIVDYLKAGINIGLGTDDAPCNNNNDMFEVMKYASLFQKAVHTDASLLPSEQVLYMATMGGARALGLEKEIGSLEKGKKADIILVNLRTLSLTPVLMGKNFNVLAHLVFAAHGENVDSVLIDGKVIMRGRQLLNVDEEKIITEATQAAQRVIQARK